MLLLFQNKRFANILLIILTEIHIVFGINSFYALLLKADFKFADRI